MQHTLELLGQVSSIASSMAASKEVLEGWVTVDFTSEYNWISEQLMRSYPWLGDIGCLTSTLVQRTNQGSN